MSFVDDSLMGASPARSTKAGGKSGAFGSLGAGANNAAFENAITDAGKKKPSAVPMSLKNDLAGLGSAIEPGRKDTGKIDIGKPLRIDAADDGQLPTKDVEVSRQSVAAKTGKVFASLPIQNLALKEETSKTARPQMATPTSLPERSLPVSDRAIINVKLDIDVVSADILPDEKTLAHAERANDIPDVKLPPSMEKMLELAKDGRLSPAKPADLAKAASVEAKSQPTSLDDDDKSATESDNIETGGVGQLLALLGSPKELPVTSAEVRTTSTELISEFQALADRAGSDRAGKARNDNRQASGADTQRQALAADANAVANATASGGADQTFRFARADGKGQSVSMSINTDGDKPSARIDASGTKADAASNAKAETVTVLDSRRYLGIAANTNSQAVAAAVTGSTEWARAMQPSSGLSSPEAASAASKVVNTLKIQMHPIDLGMVTATLRLKDDELHVDLKVESGEAFRQLSDDQNAMVKALRAQGFAVDQINITFNAPSDTSSGNSGSQQTQAQAGQLGRDASGDGAAQGRSRNNDSSQQQSGERWTGHGTTDEVSAASESGRTDHTYM